MHFRPRNRKLFFYAAGLPLFAALVFAAELGLYYAEYHQSWVLAALSLGAFIAWVNMLIIWLDCELIWKSPVTRCPTYDTSIWHPLWVSSLNIWIARFGLGCLVAILHVACMILPSAVRARQSAQADVMRGEVIECTEDQTSPAATNLFEGARLQKGLAVSAK
ncbi:hypothetical protein Slin14017_G087580 [Septoria linicola]|nr:hypothetical protein Slin14017_G087580 [Septoria linicola]